MRPSVLAYMTCAVGVSLLAACPDRSISKVSPVQTGTATKNIPVSADIDILFVIDNSLSTADKQALFATNFPAFVNILDTKFGQGRPNLHIGVVSTTVGTGSSVNLGSSCPETAPGDDGKFHNAMVGASSGGTVGTTSCSSCTITGSFITDIASGGSRQTNYNCPGGSGTDPNNLTAALPCMAEIGTSGCGFEAQLEAMKRALDGSQSSNAGFIRNGAYLGVIILTDEDDCSIKDPSIFSLNNVGGLSDFRCQPMYAYKCDTAITPATGTTNYTNCTPVSGASSQYLQDTSYYYNFLTTVKDPSEIVVAVIGGTDSMGNMPNPAGFNISTGSVQIPGQPTAQDPALSPSCMTTINGNMAIARPGLRLADFVSQFGTRGKYYSVCQSDYSTALADIGTELFNAISPCLEGAIDTTDEDPNNPGLQPQCTVSYIQNFGSTGQTEQQIPVCQMQTGANTSITPPCNNGPCPKMGAMEPCWYVSTDNVTCADPTAFPTHLTLNVVSTSAPPPGTVTSVSCAVSSM